MKYKSTPAGIIFDFINTIIMVFAFIITVYPFLYVINYSFSTFSQVSGTLLLFPRGFNVQAYVTLLHDTKLIHAAFISVSRSIIGPVLSLAVTGMAAYALAVPDLVFGKFFRNMFVLTMYVGSGLIPTYLFMKWYGLANNYLVYIIPNLFNAYNMILIKTYIESIPRSLQEAVYLDGGDDFVAYWRVVFPVCKPVSAAILLFSVLGHWNSFMDTQIYCAATQKLHTLQYVLYNILASNTNLEALKSGSQRVMANGQTLKMAITVITVVPVMFVYPFLQKYFVSGIMIGSVKA